MIAVRRMDPTAVRLLTEEATRGRCRPTEQAGPTVPEPMVADLTVAELLRIQPEATVAEADRQAAIAAVDALQSAAEATSRPPATAPAAVATAAVAAAAAHTEAVTNFNSMVALCAALRSGVFFKRIFIRLPVRGFLGVTLRPLWFAFPAI